VTRFDDWSNPGVSGIAELRVAPPWLTVLVLVAHSLLTGAATVIRVRSLPGTLAAGGLVILNRVTLRTWL